MREPLLEVFPAALLGRLVTIPYYPLNDAMLSAIVELQLGRIARRIEDNHRVPLTYDGALVRLIAERCSEVESGARVVDAILTNTLLPAISQEFLARTLDGRTVGRVAIGVADGAIDYTFD